MEFQVCVDSYIPLVLGKLFNWYGLIITIFLIAAAARNLSHIDLISLVAAVDDRKNNWHSR